MLPGPAPVAETESAPVCRPLKIPYYESPPMGGRPVVDHCVIQQVDGLLHAVLGARLEWDALATDDAESHCVKRSLLPYETFGDWLGLFLAPATSMPALVAMAMTHHCVGVFIVPRLMSDAFDAAPVNISKKSGRTAVTTTLPWTSWLAKNRVWSVDIDGAAFACPPPAPMQALIVSFSSDRRRLRRHKRPDVLSASTMTVAPLGRTLTTHKIGVMPRLIHRAAPASAQHLPTVARDKAPDEGAIPNWSPGLAEVPQPPRCPFDVEKIAAKTADFPMREARDYGLQAMRGELMAFGGMLKKSVAPKPTVFTREEQAMLLKALLKDVGKGFRAGPYSTIPFEYYRLCNVFGREKHKYRLEHDDVLKEIRVVHNYSEGYDRHSAVGSLNDLSMSPRWICSYLTVGLLINIIVQAGPGARIAWWDVPSAFKNIPNNRELLHLFVTQLQTDEGMKYFVELSNCFGWVPSEWSWQAVISLIMHCLEKTGIGGLQYYVDNIFCIVPSNSKLGLDATVRKVEAELADNNVPLHESGKGTYCDAALGWELDLDVKGHPRGWTATIICQELKLKYYRQQVRRWSNATTMKAKDVQILAGIMQYVATVMLVGRAFVPHVLALIKRCKFGGSGPRRFRPTYPVIKLTEPVRDALRFYDSILRSWDGVAPMVQGFGPTAHDECIGFVDASTDDGCGGWIWIPATKTLRGFVHLWSADEKADAFVDAFWSSTVYESGGITMWIEQYACLCEAKRTHLRTDNRPAYDSFQRAFSDTPKVREALFKARLTAGRHFMCLRVSWVFEHPV